MTTRKLPWIAAALGCSLLLIVVAGSQPAAAGGPQLPLLTRLLMNEFGFLLNLAGVWFALKHNREQRSMPLLLVGGVCALLVLAFGLLAVMLWPA